MSHYECACVDIKLQISSVNDRPVIDKTESQSSLDTRPKYPTSVPYLSTLSQYPTSVPYLSTLPQYPTSVPYLSTLPQYPTSVPYLSTLSQYPTPTAGMGAAARSR